MSKLSDYLMRMSNKEHGLTKEALAIHNLSETNEKAKAVITEYSNLIVITKNPFGEMVSYCNGQYIDSFVYAFEAFDKIWDKEKLELK